MAVFWQTIDETGRHLDALLLPKIEGLLIVAVEGLQRCLQPEGESERVEFLAFAAPFLGHFYSYVLPEVAKHRHIVARDVSATGTRGSLTMPHSMASMSEKSLIVQGNKVPSA